MPSVRRRHPSFEHLVPDYQDLEQDLLTSFVDLKRNTMRTLYGDDADGGFDKSPKGSVDVAIRPLVDLINAHPSFTTLSSCSGRITLFDPHLNDGVEGKNDSTEDGQAVIRQNVPELVSGKGRGGWLLSSHKQVEPSVLVQLLDAEESQHHSNLDANNSRPLVFKHEPLLLHVAASTLSRGRQLLTLVLRLGFRESGLVVTPTKVTVAIRGHSLALTVPLSKHGPLRPSNDYLNALINEANQRMHSNQDKLLRLQTEVEDDLFRPRNTQKNTVSSCNATFNPVPPLNLWGHAAVAVASTPPNRGNDDLDVLVFGGYGCGPDISENDDQNSDQEANRPCRRSNRVYCLSRQDGLWRDHWTEVVQSPLPDDDAKKLVQTSYGLEALLVPFTAREGLDACVLPLDEAVQNSTIAAPTVVALWGGRAGPSRPLDELLLYEPNNTHSGGCSFMSPCDVRGEAPAPRWGHAFTTLSGRDGRLAVLTGGRNANESIDTVHMLSLVITDGDIVNHLLWQTVDLGLPSQFHHSVVRYADSIIVFGGLSDPNDLLETFTDSNCASGPKEPKPVSAFRIEGGSNISMERSIHVKNPTMAEIVPYFGASTCVVAVSDAADGSIQHTVALVGGLPCNGSIASQDEEPLRCFTICNNPEDDDNGMELSPLKVHFAKGPMLASQDIDFNSMVHHCAISVPSCDDNRMENTAEMLLLGGGVDSFAFGSTFANCYRVQVGLGFPEMLHSKVSIGSSKYALDITSKSQRKSRVVNGARTQVTNVVYVTNKDAKTLKTALENAFFLDKTFRMTKAEPEASKQWDPKLHIAVPVTTSCLTVLSGDSNDEASSPSWCSLVVGTGQQEMPYSSAILGLKQK